MAGWRFAIDRGGTFTDLLAIDPEGGRHALKLLSQAPGQYQDAVLEGIARLMDWPCERPLRKAPIRSVRLGTTVATNALLERAGAKVGLLLSEGFVDLLEIDDQSRPELFKLDKRKPKPLYAAVASVPGRLDAQGRQLAALDLEMLRERMLHWQSAGIEAVAISFMHAWRHPDHELQARALARQIGFDWVICGHRASPLTRYLDRCHTALIDAYLTPVVRRYVDGLEEALGPDRLLMMQSDGALVSANEFRGATAVLSGPAGGASACASLSKVLQVQTGQGNGTGLIGFDMGGTSTDVCLATAGRVARSWRSVAGVRLGLPMLEVHTVAAGGGSIIDFVDGQLTVGPASAGADPGPACYGRGGPATITDANLVLGRLHGPDLPAVFGADGKQPVDRELALASLNELAARIRSAGGPDYSTAALAAGAVALADESMAQAVHGLTSARGIDPAELVLNGFGGAAGQHLCGVADQLGVSRLCLHPYAGVLSAWGIGSSAQGRYAELALELPLDAAALSLAQRLLNEHQQRRPARLAELAMTSRCRLRTRLEGGGELAFSLLLQDGWERVGGEQLSVLRSTLQRAFAEQFKSHFGYAPPTADCVAVALIVEEQAPAPDWPGIELAANGAEPGLLSAHDGTRTFSLRHLRHDQLPQGVTLAGPALVSHPLSTLYLASGWSLTVDEDLSWQISRADKHARTAAAQEQQAPRQSDPLQLALYHHRFMHIAEQMGEVLRASARSVNIRERLDYSCALFDACGQLIANAPHMPVHLGSMGESVRAVLTAYAAEIRAGDAFVLNDPYQGGTHLPDITVVTPAFNQGQLIALFASRAHHADVGGISPGSMPANSRQVSEEGVLIAPTRIVIAGELNRDLVTRLFAQQPWPSRDPALNVGEVEAQLAANQRGLELFYQLLEGHGSAAVAAYLGFVLEHTEGLLRERIRSLSGGSATLNLDQGLRIAVEVSVDSQEGSIKVDFAGTSAQSVDNYNAPSAVVRAAVLYVLRCLLDHPVPLNEGFARPLTLRLPERSLVSPQSPAAVVAGNVETSQAITDALLLALGAQAGSQGTMNNLSFGNPNFQYYETICGGAGAGPGFNGASAVHTHMTNSRITDPEVMERRFPLHLERFERRAGSGGGGRWRGGEGVVRRIRFLEAVEMSILTSRRHYPPPGLMGGEPGVPGETVVITGNGECRNLAHAESVSLAAGDAVEVRSPGGGGYGFPD